MPSRSNLRSTYADASALSALSADGEDDDDDDGEDDTDDGAYDADEVDTMGDEEVEEVIAREGSDSCCTLRSSRKSDDGECLVSAHKLTNHGV